VDLECNNTHNLNEEGVVMYKIKENVCVDDNWQLDKLSQFYKKNFQGRLPWNSMEVEYPFLAYCGTSCYPSCYFWGWDREDHLTGGELSVEEFMIRYDPSYEAASTVEKETKEENKEKDWTASHYDVNYTLSKKEIEQGFVRLDTYKVNKAWGLNSVDATGAAFHCLKTLNRIPRQKNPLERELRALVGQIKCWSNEEEIDLSDILK